MSFLEKVRATVGQGISLVTSEADKTLRLTRLRSELATKRQELDKAYVDLGKGTYESNSDEGATADSLQELKQKVEDIQAQIVQLEQEMAEVRVGGKVPEVKVTAVEHVCTSCGKSVPDGMQFCGHCGHAL